MHHVQPHVTFELGLFKADYNFDTLLLPCYTGALVGPLVAKSPEESGFILSTIFTKFYSSAFQRFIDCTQFYKSCYLRETISIKP